MYGAKINYTKYDANEYVHSKYSQHKDKKIRTAKGKMAGITNDIVEVANNGKYGVPKYNEHQGSKI